MIDNLRALKLAKNYREQAQFLTDKLGKDFEGEILIYDLLELNPDPAITEAIGQYSKAKWLLRRFLQENDTVTGAIEPSVRQVLDSLALENVSEASDYESLPNDRCEELASRLLWDWWGPRDFVLGYLRAKPLISASNLPGRLHELVGEARRCYGFRQLNAVMALGRMILEFAITDIGVKIGRFPAPESLDDFYSAYPPTNRADKLLGDSGPRRKRFRELYNAGSKTIHSSTDRPDDDSSVLAYLCDVIEFVSEQYAIHIRP